MATFTEAAPTQTPSTYADERKAWTGTLTGTDIPLRIEAASYRGRPVLFDLVLPWQETARDAPPQRGNNNWLFVTLLLCGAAMAAWSNLRHGRADRRGAFRLAAFMTLLLTAGWVVGPHVPSGAEEQQRFFARVGIALFVAGAMYIVYLGFEPFVRRLWPSMLVGWSRVLSGRLRDPLIGHDALVGVACGGVIVILSLLRENVLPPMLGLAMPQPHLTPVAPLLGLRPALSAIINAVNNGLQNALITVFQFSFFRAVFEWITRTPFGAHRRTVGGTLRMSERASEKIFVALVVLVVTAASIGSTGSAAERYLPAEDQFISTLLTLVVLLRVGIFGIAVMLTTSSLIDGIPMTFDSSALYAAGAWMALAAVLGTAVIGYRLATEHPRPV
jgi:hypothetical protein